MNTNKNDYDLIKIQEKIMQVVDGEINYYITPFISLAYQFEINKLIKRYHLNSLSLNNGERKVILIGDNSNYTNPIILLEIISHEELKHNEIMGAILNIGIEREVIGNIYIHNNTYLIEVLSSMKDYIIDNFNYVSHNKIKVVETNKEIPNIVHEIKEVIVSSNRLDNMVSSIFNMSRESAKEAINLHDVSLNFQTDLKIDQKVPYGSYLSCRRKGKVYIIEEKGKTKKDNLVIRVEIF